MAKATTRKAAPKRVRIKGATEADKQNIALARKVNAEEAKGKVEVVSPADKLPTADDSPRAARDKMQRQFDKADDKGRQAMIDSATLSRAVNGY